MSTLSESVESRIKQIFIDIAAEVGDDFTEEECAGIPSALFHAQTAMIKAWKKYMEGVRHDDDTT